MENTYFAGCQSLNEAKVRFLALAKQHYPAKNGNPGVMFQIRLEYQQIRNDPSFAFHQHTEDVKVDFMQFPDVVDKILGWPLEIEIIGTWTWVSGYSYDYKDELLKMGFYYEPGKQSWYSRPTSYRSTNPKPLDFDRIRSLHGRNTINLLGGELSSGGIQP